MNDGANGFHFCRPENNHGLASDPLKAIVALAEGWLVIGQVVPDAFSTMPRPLHP